MSSCTRDAEPLGGVGEAPDQPAGVDEPDGGVEHPAEVARRVDRGSRLRGVEQVDRDPVLAVQVVGLAHGVDLVLVERQGDLAGNVEVGRRCRAASTVSASPAKFSRPEPLEGRHLVRPAGDPLGEPVGQRR